MDSKAIIFCIICLITGLLIGFVTELLANVKLVKELEKENKHLRIELANQQKLNQLEVIEIRDSRKVIPEDIDWSRTW